MRLWLVALARRVRWETRFIGHAFLQRDFNDPRVQSLVEERMAALGFRAADSQDQPPDAV